jgi:hypothetical protein
MKKRYILSFILIMAGVFCAFPVWAGQSVTAYVGSVGFANRIGDSLQYSYQSDFNEVSGTRLTNPPFSVGANVSYIHTDGSGLLILNYDGGEHSHADVELQDNHSLSNAAYYVNFQNGLPVAGTGYSMGFGIYASGHTLIDGAMLNVVTFGNNQSYLFFSDEEKTGKNGKALALIPLSGISSIALGLTVGADGTVMAGYILNPKDGLMQLADLALWTKISATTKLDQQLYSEPYGAYISPFNVIPQEVPSSVPVPAAVWLLGSGLLGLAGLRRKIGK